MIEATRPQGRRADLRPADLLEVQDTLRQWWRTEVGRAFAKGWAEAPKAGGAGEDDLAGTQAYILGRAESFWVSDEMATLVQVSAASMPRQDLRMEDLPHPYGFIWFDRPLWITDVRGKRVGLRAVSWAEREIAWRVRGEDRLATLVDPTMLQGISLCWYSDVTDDEDEVNADLRADLEGKGGSWADYVRLSHRLSTFHVDAWPYGTSFAPPDLEAQEGVMDTRRFLAAFLALAGQRLAHVGKETAPRHLRRRLERSGTLDPTKEVSVVTLRRYRERGIEDKGEDSPEAIEWSHRWMVSGHWRNQWVPSLNDHRLTWIAPYVKGPEDRPLLVKDTVFALRR